ncbi:NlpC/P60 family protein [Kitasatospora viridis]|uniref:Cell wall-associated NlpC family hydrolase n=1 Tax=Kitasatospora viridis TaxID=281105 RepID=A0A561UGK6_9ACTN|nr:NlpC/P60 family protein [Kitasatospora viridis]TWF98495.1 cell wall-associated NlpC family hydrolase [Kitasatospora viridis]
MVLRNGPRAAIAAGALGAGFLLLIGLGTYAASGVPQTTDGSGLGLAPGTVPAAYQALIQQAGTGTCAQVTAPLLAAQLYQESGFNPNAVSPVGAQGISQIMPATWAQYAVNNWQNPWDPSQAIPMAAHIDCEYAKDVASVPGDPQANMLAAYNAGTDAVLRYQGVPPYSETQSYVKSILALARTFTAASAPVDVSAQASGAIYFAQSRLGTPYEWGGDGADGRFDCSGLTMMAFRSVGIELPRVANDQWNAGQHPSRDQLRPGDLVFFATDLTDPRSIHHVGIYVGGGYMIDAPHTGAVIRYDTIDQKEYFGATRVTPDGAAALPSRNPDGTISGGSALDGRGNSTLAGAASPSPGATRTP